MITNERNEGSLSSLVFSPLLEGDEFLTQAMLAQDNSAATAGQSPSVDDLNEATRAAGIPAERWRRSAVAHGLTNARRRR